MVSEENVNHPSHYGGDITYEPIKFIEYWNFGFHLGNAIKYLVRFQTNKKGTDRLEDLKKAAWYINRKIEQLEQQEE
jgi:Protein of unknwon function (DUF3310)